MRYNPETHHRRSIRLKGYDYSQAGLYFITLCVQDRACLFGEIANGKMILNEMGQIAFNEWMKTSELRNNVELDVLVIMPNHIHGIIILNDVIGRGESHSPDALLLGECDSPLRSPSNNIGAIVRGYKSSVTKQIHALNGRDSVWQRNYYEHIIRNEQSYQNISEYIIDNPSKWKADKFYK